MHKDFKIGLGVGLLLVVAAVIWLCTSPKLSTESRAIQNASSKPAPTITVIPQLPVEIKPQTPEKAVRFHVVEKGQTLSQIAEQYYGSQGQWPKIVNANRDILPDPNRLTPGLKLIIPE
jgi:nucleoid-associated protein YgaU